MKTSGDKNEKTREPFINGLGNTTIIELIKMKLQQGT